MWDYLKRELTFHLTQHNLAPLVVASCTQQEVVCSILQSSTFCLGQVGPIPWATWAIWPARVDAGFRSSLGPEWTYEGF